MLLYHGTAFPILLWIFFIPSVFFINPLIWEVEDHVLLKIMRTFHLISLDEVYHVHTF